ncbi:DUF4013 domain-containing protein [Haladaptatus sp. CMSO5]|uniref:DUF4013 domain-containing protein n=1 Tax=Haladaptatus sp. CMSO5 TaxID=3120514 RepID=UPI002FCDE9A2
MLSEALSFPRNDDDWVKTIAIGGVLSILSVFILPVFLVQGYFVRVLRAGVSGEQTPPKFDEWADLFTDGLMVFVISIAYVAIPSILALIGFAILGVGFAAGAQADSGGIMASVGVLGLIFGLLVTVLFLLVAYTIPAAMANFAAKDSLGAGFEFGTILSIALTGDYLVAWLLAVGVSIVLGAVAGALMFVLVGIFVAFYVQMVVYYIYGRGYANAQAGTEPQTTAHTA